MTAAISIEAACDPEDGGVHHVCECIIRRERELCDALQTVVTVCARVPQGEPLEPGQVSFLLEKAKEALDQ